MFGSVARTRVKPENRAALHELMERQDYHKVEGFQSSFILWENDSDVAWMFGIFESRELYYKNADDPAQNDRYLEFRALLEEDPEWHDGEVESA
jgi:hypothetical protein